MILVSKLLVPKGYTGLAVFPFIFLKTNKLKADKTLINHERIHLRQQLELLVIPFFGIYIVEFVIRLLYIRNWRKAYRAISFEKEAYANEADLDYLKSRPFWRFTAYF